MRHHYLNRLAGLGAYLVIQVYRLLNDGTAGLICGQRTLVKVNLHQQLTELNGLGSGSSVAVVNNSSNGEGIVFGCAEPLCDGECVNCYWFFCCHQMLMHGSCLQSEDCSQKQAVSSQSHPQSSCVSRQLTHSSMSPCSMTGGSGKVSAGRGSVVTISGLRYLPQAITAKPPCQASLLNSLANCSSTISFCFALSASKSCKKGAN